MIMPLDFELPVYDTLGASYDHTRHADPYLASRLAHHLNLQTDQRYLDLACGTGNYTDVLSQMGGRWIGLDRSWRMIAQAHTKTSIIDCCQADGHALPFRSGSFAGVMSTLAVHYFTDLVEIFSEVRRVLDGGPIVIFTGEAGQMEQYWLNVYFPRAMRRSMVQMPTQASLINALEQAGFTDIQTEPYTVREDLRDLFLYSGKHKPAFYLDSMIRQNISTFSIHGDAEEIETGCHRLKADMESGRIQDVIESYENDGGDYLFLIATK